MRSSRHLVKKIVKMHTLQVWSGVRGLGGHEEFKCLSGKWFEVLQIQDSDRIGDALIKVKSEVPTEFRFTDEVIDVPRIQKIAGMLQVRFDKVADLLVIVPRPVLPAVQMMQEAVEVHQRRCTNASSPTEL